MTVLSALRTGVFSALLLTSFSGLAWAHACRPTEVALDIRGSDKVKVIRDGAETRALENGMLLFPGDVLELRDKGRARVEVTVYASKNTDSTDARSFLTFSEGTRHKVAGECAASGSVGWMIELMRIVLGNDPYPKMPQNLVTLSPKKSGENGVDPDATPVWRGLPDLQYRLSADAKAIAVSWDVVPGKVILQDAASGAELVQSSLSASGSVTLDLPSLEAGDELFLNVETNSGKRGEPRRVLIVPAGSPPTPTQGDGDLSFGDHAVWMYVKAAPEWRLQALSLLHDSARSDALSDFMFRKALTAPTVE
ncbi:hypothetical protein So717_36640 [Roseobacter cerasinus]|uniref:Uncharacterized protein n=1 Tax=Roseobacter cerasinus TaxID=2602289 RepID=A0A640VXU2_9RHOB|nr:hypothetical protein [Roseobacter cerasinus]GFE51911.1 hypothetical protein So717_36640 [Roseobacter cerasinus]